MKEVEFVNNVIRGGKCNDAKTLTVYGGSNIKKKVVIDNTLSNNIKSNIFDWVLFKQVNPDIVGIDVVNINENLNIPETNSEYVILDDSASKDRKNKNMINTINSILNLSEYLHDSKSIILFVEELFNYSNKDIINIISNSLDLKNVYNLAIESLFFVWKDLIEYLLHILINKYNEYCELNDINDIIDKELIFNKLNKSLIENNIDTSSHILFFLCLPKKYNSNEYKSLHNIPKLIFKKSTKFSSSLNKSIQKFNDYFYSNKIKQYEYIGFCPLEPTKRLKLLLNFPLELIIDLINNIDSTALIGIDFNSILKEISVIIEDIKMYKNKNIDTNFEKPKLKKYKNDTQINEKLINRVDSFISLYQTIFSQLMEKEKIYNLISEKISKIIDIIQNIFTLL
jgi:hypothetical protein